MKGILEEEEDEIEAAVMEEDKEEEEMIWMSFGKVLKGILTEEKD